MFDELKEFGLSENEVSIYLALLKLGLSTSNRISQITGIKRTTTYDNLNVLINRGLISVIVKEKVHYYEAVNPSKIIDILDERKDKINKILPELLNYRKTISEKTGVTFFEGKKGVVTVFNDILDDAKELLFYGSRKMALVTLKHYPENFIQKRAQKNIALKAILAEEDRNDPVYDNKKIFQLSNLRFSKELNNTKTNVFIYANKVAFVTSDDNPVGIIITDKNILEQQKLIFNILWNNSKK